MPEEIRGRLSLGSKLAYQGVTDVAVARQAFFRVIQDKAPRVIDDLRKALNAYHNYAACPWVCCLLPKGKFKWMSVPALLGPLTWPTLTEAAATESRWNQMEVDDHNASLLQRADVQIQEYIAKQRFYDALNNNDDTAKKHKELLLSEQLPDQEFLNQWGDSERILPNRFGTLYEMVDTWANRYHLVDDWIKDAALILLARWDRDPTRSWEYPVAYGRTEDGVSIVMQPGLPTLMHDEITTIIGNAIMEEWIDAHGGLKPINNPLPEPQPEEGETPDSWQRRVAEYIAADYTFVPPPARLGPPEPPQLKWDPAIQDEAAWEDAKAGYLATAAEYIEQYKKWALSNAKAQGWNKPPTKRARGESPLLHFDWLVDYQISNQSFKDIANRWSSPARDAQLYDPSVVGKAIRKTAFLMKLTLRQ